MELTGGKAWWFPIGSEDHVRLTEDVMSYELDGELRLAKSMGAIERIELAIEDRHGWNPGAPA